MRHATRDEATDASKPMAYWAGYHAESSAHGLVSEASAVTLNPWLIQSTVSHA